MTSSRRLDIAADARKDIRSILRASGKAWGADHRDRYGQEMRDAMKRLTGFPQLGKRVEPETVGMRALPVG